MAFTRRSGFPVTGSTSGGYDSITVDPVAVGDLMIAFYFGSGFVTFSGGGVTTWNTVLQFDSADGGYMTLAIGEVTSTGSQALTMSTTATEYAVLNADSYSCTNTGTYFAESSGETQSGTTTTTSVLPSLTPTLVGGLYWGYAAPNGGTNTGTVTPSGFTIEIDEDGNAIIDGTSLTSGTAYAPTATQSSSPGYQCLAAIFNTLPSSSSGFFALL